MLPARLAPAGSAAAVGSAATKAAAAAAVVLGTRLVNVERAAVDFTAVQAGDGAIRIGGFGHFDKRKTTRPAGIPIRDQIDTFDVAVRRKQRSDRRFSSGKIQIAYENVLHNNSSVLAIRAKARQFGLPGCCWKSYNANSNMLLRNLSPMPKPENTVVARSSEDAENVAGTALRTEEMGTSPAKLAWLRRRDAL